MRTQDTWTRVDDHYIGHDGFVCPATFEEFNDRYPDYLKLLARKFSYNKLNDSDVEDVAQTMVAAFLTKRTVERFDPVKTHGANERRWFSYITLCTGREVQTAWLKGTRNPLKDGEQLVDTTRYSMEFGSRMEDRLFVHGFKKFVYERSEELLPIINALETTESLTEAANSLGICRITLSRKVKAIKKLAKRFANV
jgi:hypothetical protein